MSRLLKQGLFSLGILFVIGLTNAWADYTVTVENWPFLSHASRNEIPVNAQEVPLLIINNSWHAMYFPYGNVKVLIPAYSERSIIIPFTDQELLLTDWYGDEVYYSWHMVRQMPITVSSNGDSNAFAAKMAQWEAVLQQIMANNQPVSYDYPRKSEPVYYTTPQRSVRGYW